MNRYWISWYSMTPLSEFEYHGPWWVSGYDAEDNPTVCAAVVAENEEVAEEIILGSYDHPENTDVRWRFAEERDSSWEPFTQRFPQADWMKWPWPKND